MKSIQNKDLSVINEAINLESQFIFIAIPKTGTTSVRTQIRQVGTELVPNPHLNIIQIRDLIYVHFLRESLGKNKRFPGEHVPSDRMLRDRAAKLFSDCFKFSAVRNPWARAVSLYFRREGVQVSSKMSFKEFCEQHMFASDTCSQPTLHRCQYDWLCDENGRMIMDYVYKVEEFASAIEEIEKLTNGRLKLKNLNRNSNPDSTSRDYSNMYDADTKKLIAKQFEKDIDWFKYSF